MVDRDARNRLAELIRRYLDEEMKAFDFDDALEEFSESHDDAVRFVSGALWYHYDDCDDHLVVLSKPEWNYFQRLLLLLESNSTVKFTQSWHWTYTQLLAAAFLLLCIGIMVKTGFGYHLLVFFIPFGIGSIVISFLRRPGENVGPYDAIITPFESLGDLRFAYKNTSFRKVHYRSQLANRTIRSPFMNWFWTVHCYICWSVLAPIPLLFQCFPSTISNIRINPA